MRILAALLFAAFAMAPAAAQVPTGALEALRRDFPAGHATLAAQLGGKTPEEGRRIAYEAIDRFLRAHVDEILAAPGPSIVALEARQGALLRSLGRQDVKACAIIGDRGFFGPEALASAPPPGLDEFGAALVAAAKAGAGAKSAPPPPTKEDFLAWMDAIAKIEPAVPVRNMLIDKAVRAAASDDHLCRGAAAMHEAAVALPGARGEIMSRTMLRYSISVQPD